MVTSFPQLSVIIVSFNVKYFMEQCLHSLQIALTDVAAEIFVVDNNSTDGTVDFLKNKFPDINIIENKENVGFGKANNQAIGQAKGKYILFLNPDTLIPQDTFKDIFLFLQQQPQAGGIGVRMLDGQGNFLPESKRSRPSALVSFFKLSGLSALFPRSKWINKYALGNISPYNTAPVPVLAGAFILVGKKIIDQIGGFDERFFMYGEDIDLSMRIEMAGYPNYYLGSVPIIHFKGESTTGSYNYYVRIFYRAMIQFVQKYYSGWKGLFSRIFLNIGIFIRANIGILNHFFRPPLKVRDFPLPKSVVCIGDVAACEVAKIILKKNIPDVQVLDLSLSAQADAWIFCNGSQFDYRDAMRYMECHKNSKATIFWHSCDTASIIGGTNFSTSSVVWA